MDIKIISSKISKIDLQKIAKELYGDLVKAVVDIELKTMAIGGDLHADEEAVLLENGSKQENLWGINIYPFETGNKFVEFDSIINIRPSQNNRSRLVENPLLQKKILKIVNFLIEF